MTTVPTFVDKRQSARDLIQRTRTFNVKMAELSKQAMRESPTGNIEGTLENLSMLMTGDYGEEETVKIPVDIVRQMAMFAAVTVSRLLEERYKLEKKLGRPAVVAPIVQPTAEEILEVLSDDDLTDDAS